MATWNRASFCEARVLVCAALEAEPLPEGWSYMMTWNDASRSGVGQGSNRGSFGEVKAYRLKRIRGMGRGTNVTLGRFHGSEKRESGRGWAEKEAPRMVARLRERVAEAEKAWQERRAATLATLEARTVLGAKLAALRDDIRLAFADFATGDNDADTDLRYQLHNADEALKKAGLRLRILAYELEEIDEDPTRRP